MNYNVACSLLAWCNVNVDDAQAQTGNNMLVQERLKPSYFNRSWSSFGLVRCSTVVQVPIDLYHHDAECQRGPSITALDPVGEAVSGHYDK
jgi:hypothetical protein